jgi:hypothetical protein
MSRGSHAAEASKEPQTEPADPENKKAEQQMSTIRYYARLRVLPLHRTVKDAPPPKIIVEL